MGFSWISAFKLIPWVDVVQAAPGVVRGARDLWARTRKTKPVPVATGQSALPPDLAQLAARIEQLEAEQIEATALINTLAEQNAKLVSAMDAVRVRTRALLAFSVLLAAAVVALWLR